MSASVGRFLDDLGLGRYAAVLAEHEVDLDTLPELTEADLKELGLPLGPRRKLLKAARALNQERAATAARAPGATAGAPAGPVPGHLAERVLAQRHALVGERKQITILFADVAGSTSLVQALDPEEADRALGPALQAMVEAVHRFEGTVNRLQGDGLMAMFGAPLALEDHALRACHAALDMRERLAAEGGPPLRVGLHSGEVVVRAIGNDLSMNYDAMGLSAHLAARMEQMAEPGSICLSADTWRLVDGYVSGEYLGAKAVKGLDAPVDAYRLESVAARSRLDVARERGLTPYVGREAELQLLEDRLARARAGRGQVVTLLAEPGMGKSRLLLELRRRLQDSVEWSEGRALSFGADMAFWPLVDLLRRRFGIADSDDEATVAGKVNEGVAAAGADARAGLPYVRYLLSLDPGDPQVMALDSRLRRQGVFDAVRTVLLCAAQRRTQVVVFEDLHWADQATVEFLEYLAAGVSGAAALLLLTARPGSPRAVPEGTTTHTTLALSSLDSDATLRMTRTLLETASTPAELQQHVASLTDGNPLFVEELVRSLLEDGALRRDGGTLVLARPLAATAAPRTIQDLLAARIDRLPDRAKSTLQLASVIGREFPRDLLARVDRQEAELAEALRALEASGLVHLRSHAPAPVYAFKHALAQEVAYQSMLRDRRRELHTSVGHALEQLHAGQLAELGEVLALHFERGGVVDRAVEYLEKAAARAVGAFAVPAALELYRRALELTAGTADRALAGKRVAFMKARAGLHFLVGNYAAARTEWERLLASCRAQGDRFNEAGALAGAAWATQWDEDFEQAMRYAGEAVQLATEVGNDSARAGGLVVSGYIPAVTARLEEARPVLEQAMQVGRAAGDVVNEVIARFALGSLHNWQGDFDAALDVAGEGLRIARERKVLPLLIRTLWVNGLARVGRGDFDTARALLQEGSELADRVGDEALAPRLLNTLGWLHLECQDFERGIELNVRAAERAQARRHAISVEMETYSRINHADALLAMGSVEDAWEVYGRAQGVVSNPKTHPWMKWRYSTHLFTSLAEYWLACGRPERAREPLQQNMVIAGQTGSRKYLAIGHRIAARLALHGLQLEDAETAAREALAQARRIANPGQLWRCHDLLADVLERRGREPEARQARARAGSVIRTVLDALQDPDLRAGLRRSPDTERLLQAGDG